MVKFGKIGKKSGRNVLRNTCMNMNTAEKNLTFTGYISMNDISMNDFQYVVVMTFPGNIDHVNTIKS